MGIEPKVSMSILTFGEEVEFFAALEEAGRVAQGYSPNGAPFNQTYEYDEFGNMKGRSGTYYWQPYQSDAGSFSNNRRNGWSYSADGQVTANPASITDNAHSFSYDASNRLTNSIETIGSGTISYSPAYDGDGKLVYESQVTTGSLPSSSSSYVVRATGLGGQILTRLDQNGNKSITYVPAEGLLFATQTVTQNVAGVGWTQRDPVGISETGKGVYDPLGNYLPFQPHNDPRPPVGSYNSSSMAGFYASFASDPFQLNVGCIRDGLPTSCDRVLHDINSGLARQVTIGGTQNPNVALANAGFIPQVRSQEVRPNFPDPLDERNLFTEVVDVIDSVAIIPGRQTGFEPNPTNPQNNKGKPLSETEVDQLQSAVAGLLKDEKCSKFVRALLNQIGEDTHRKAYSSKVLDIFDAVRKQGGFGRRQMIASAEGGSTVGNKDAFINIGNYTVANEPYAMASLGRTIIHELLHIGSNTNQNYSHAMFKAAYAVAQSQGGYTLGSRPGPIDPQGKDFPNAYNFDDILFQACRVR